MGIPDWIFSWSAFDLLLHFYFNNHTFQWKFSTWFFVISASPACCLALWFLWITWLNLMHEFDRHLAEWIWRKGLREVLGKRLPWESPAEHSAAPGQPMWAAQEWGLWIHRVSYHCHLLNLIYTQITSWEMPGWIIYKPDYDCWEKYQPTQICIWYHFNGRKQRGIKKSLNDSERR